MNTRGSRLFLALGLVCLGSAVTVAGHLESKEHHDLESGGFRQSKSWKTDWKIYKSIGGESFLKGKEKKRKWWCVWLCKRRVDKKADQIIIQNTYFSELSPGIFSSFQVEPKTCTNKSKCKQKEWAFGGAIEIPFPGGDTIDGLLPIDGVVTRHEIAVDGSTFIEMTEKGKHPDPGPPVID